MLKLFFILLFSLTLQAQTITQMWESSVEYKSYNHAIEAGDLKEALKIKETKMSKILAVVLKEYIADFKPKYQKKYLEKITNNLPIHFHQMLYEIHKKLSPLLVDKSVKGRNKFVQSLYHILIRVYYKEGKAQKRLAKLEKNVKFTDTKVSKDTLAILKQMAIDSDTEAAKSPEQKRKELEEYISQKDKIIAEENRKQAEEKRKQAEWDKIIKKLMSL